MDQAIKKKWVKALLSGEYEQGKKTLFMDGQYCCLGVLGRIIGKTDDDMRGGTLLRKYRNNSVIYPCIPSEIQDQLAQVNDEGVPFEMIAGLIDEAL